MGMVLPVMGVAVLVFVGVPLLEGWALGLVEVPVPLPVPPLTHADRVAAMARGSRSFLSERPAFGKDVFVPTIVTFSVKASSCEFHPYKGRSTQT
jgi:hypothetical protein